MSTKNKKIKQENKKTKKVQINLDQSIKAKTDPVIVYLIVAVIILLLVQGLNALPLYRTIRQRS